MKFFFIYYCKILNNVNKIKNKFFKIYVFFIYDYLFIDNYLILFIILSYILIGLLLDGNYNYIKIIITKLIYYIFLIIIYYFLYIHLFPDYYIIQCCSTDPGTVTATVNVNVSKEGAEALASGLQSTGSKIGLGAAIGGVAAATGKSLAGSALPPIQKIGLISVAGVIGALAHSGATPINRGLSTSITNGNSSNNVSATSIPSSNTPSLLNSTTEIEKTVVANSPLDPSIFNSFFLSFDFNNPVDVIFFSIIIINIIIFLLLILLSFSLLSRYLINSDKFIS
jgi:hypothetical protein